MKQRYKELQYIDALYKDILKLYLAFLRSII